MANLFARRRRLPQNFLSSLATLAPQPQASRLKSGRSSCSESFLQVGQSYIREGLHRGHSLAIEGAKPKGRLRHCAQFCAHHQTLPSVTECKDTAGKPLWTRHLSRSVAIRSIPCKSLILRASSPYKEEAAGSSPALPTTYRPSFLVCKVPRCARDFGPRLRRRGKRLKFESCTAHHA